MPTRYVIIGCGAGIVRHHLDALRGLPAEVVGMSDIERARGSSLAEELGCPFFVDHMDLLRELCPDIAIVCSPHPHHAQLARDCFEMGAHVLVEKPMAVDVAEADAMIEAARRAGRVLAVNFQERFRSTVEFARELITNGELGPIIRVLLVEPCLRTAAYYRSADWRGTWRGEGGGVLMNQAPHSLDLLCHLTGMPAKVWGITRTRVHSMQCEDSAQAMFEYPGGALGLLSVSTVEGGTERQLEIVGDRAALKFVGQRLTITRFYPSLSSHIASARQGSPAARTEVLDPALPAPGHRAVHADLQAAIREGRAPRCDGSEGRKSLELANAIVLSSFENRAVELPLDRPAYGRLFEGLKKLAVSKTG